jgi:hypothetical protein
VPGAPATCKDAPFAGACCPAGWQCLRQSAQQWACKPAAAAVDSCPAGGSRELAPGRACGGTQLCGRDAMCAPQCCVEGAYCRRQSASVWACSALTGFNGGRLGT